MKRVVVLGGGISGYGSAVLARERGCDVFLSDAGVISERYVDALREHGVAFEQGGHTAELILSADEVVKSPGIPDSAPVVEAVRQKNIPVVSEIEFAGRYIGDSKVICVTGSNGKTTTTSLVYQMLKDAGYDVGLGGNIGESFAYQVATAPREWYVLELSSFQLDGMFRFRADIAVLTNITPDHLDRYGGSFEAYARSKMRIVQNQRAQDVFVYQGDDPMTEKMMERFEGVQRLVPFYGPDNVAAATLAARAAGVDEGSIASTVGNFVAPDHRLQRVAVRDGVTWINDSKATNVESVVYAFRQVAGPVVWIAGGTDKGNDYAPLFEFMPRVKALVCMGVDNGKLVREFAGRVPIVFDTHSLDEAMSAARGVAQQGDTVLLSPACASFDLFENYEDRGQKFRQWIEQNC